MTKIKVDHKKVIKVNPKQIKEDFSNKSLWEIMSENCYKHSKIKLPNYDDLTFPDIQYLNKYAEGLQKYIQENLNK
jgi:coenzyme F420-reducing hydrogenase alpha subunit